MQNFASHFEDYHRSYDTYDAVDAGDSMAEESVLLQKDLHVLERKPKEKTYRNCSMSKLKCPPSIVHQMKKYHKTSSSSRTTTNSRYQRPVDSMVYNGEEVESSSSACVDKGFDLSSAQSIVQTIANPCSPAVFQNVTTELEEEDDNDGNNSLVNKLSSPSSQQRSQHPSGTPPTSGSSSGSDDEDDTSRSTGKDVAYPVVRTSTIKRGTGNNRTKKNGEGATVLFNHRSPLPNGRDIFVLVGDEQYRLTNTSTGCVANRLKNRSSVPRDKKAVLDLSCHSPLEWNVVLEFLKLSREARERIGWSKLPLLLPWFVELRSLPLASEVDMFLLHNVLGGRSDGTSRPISLASLLMLSKIAYSCGLETTKNQVRRFLRHCLLHPRKRTSSVLSKISEQDELELDWELEDLKTLAELMTVFDECREYLWEYAVITYLPHDLDISDSWGLVSNPLFPYLLREGMMQMMILDSMEASTFNQDASFNRKNNKSFSDATTSSDTTIPTSPTKGLTPKEIERNLVRIVHHLEKFQNEKEMHVSEYVSEDSSIVEKKPSSRQRRKQRQQAILSPTPPSQERFAC
jgi:hypothetical protein